MKLSKTLESAVCFAKFCSLHNLEPRDVAELMKLASDHANAQTAEHNSARSQQRSERLSNQVDEKAQAMGLPKPYYAGLMPTFRIDGHDVMLPEM